MDTVTGRLLDVVEDRTALAITSWLARRDRRWLQRMGVVALDPHRGYATVRRWEREILAWHVTDGASNGPTEAVNLLIKKIKRVGHGFRNFANYRLRLLLHCGVTWQDQPAARLRGRTPRFVA